MSDEQASLISVAPILTSYDVDATEAFYLTKLGFQTVSKYVDFGYLIVKRDDIELHFTLFTEGGPTTTQTMCYLRVKGIDAFYQEVREAGAVHPNGPLRNTAWRMREFAVLDGDGNLLRVGEAIS